MKKSKINESRTKFAIKNSVFNFLYQIVNTVSNLIVPPLIISLYGSAMNGLISTIKQIINYVQLIGSGIAESTTVYLYKPLHDKDRKKISSIYNACGYAFNKAGTIFVLITLIFSFIYPVIISGEKLDYFTIAFIILSLSIAGASEFFAIGKFRALLLADQRLYIVNISQVIGSIFSTLVTIILIKFNVSIIIVELAASITYFLRIIFLSLYIKKHYSFLNKNEPKDMEAISKRKDAMIHQLASLIIFGSQTIFIAQFCGLKEVSVYSVYSLVFVGINTILSTISSALLSGFGSLIAVESKEKLCDVYNKYELLYFMISFLIFSITYVTIIPFIKIYTQGITDVNYIRDNFVLLFTIMGLLNCIRTPGATLINAGGFYKETKNRALIEMALCIVFQFIFVQFYDVVGILLGTIVAYLYRTVDVLIYSHKRILKLKMQNTCLRIFYNFTLLLCITKLFNYINFMSCSNYLQWIIFVAIISIVLSLIFIFINYIFDRKNFRATFIYIKNVIFGR